MFEPSYARYWSRFCVSIQLSTWNIRLMVSERPYYIYNEFWSWPSWMVHLEPSVLNYLNQCNINNQKRLEFPNQTSSPDTCTRLFFFHSRNAYIHCVYAPFSLDLCEKKQNMKFNIRHMSFWALCWKFNENNCLW